MSADATAEKKTYTGACHCKKFEFEFQQSEIKEGTVCNCSICSQRGMIMTSVPGDDFKFTSGSVDELGKYQFGKKVNTHTFCPVCGSPTFVLLGNGTTVINLRAVKGIDLDSLKINKFDGANLL